MADDLRAILDNEEFTHAQRIQMAKAYLDEAGK